MTTPEASENARLPGRSRSRHRSETVKANVARSPAVVALAAAVALALAAGQSWASSILDKAMEVLSSAHLAVIRFNAWAHVSILRLQHGQGLAEYALILALIAILAIVALIFLGGQVSKVLSTVGKSI
jgi:Flp pilus assembly pilin Flp